MMIRIEPDSDIPIYEQISNQIVEGIARGLIQPGASLPSVRAFASDLGVNMHTVNKSYHQLEYKGIITIVPKSGAIISSPQDFNELSFDRLKEEYKPLIAESLVVGMSNEQIHELVSSIIEDFKKSN
ncbi:GntR family transcriptional regulator [Bacillus sp. EB106-08-02-XG196]|jgi:GntR family transcriptional regulator|uniref:GntR family transcriptional regulator n=1 Tax=Bacillus sp. EB106-08-02-XG196 TaxID=2737049 RepID=UPI0015C4B3D9|nr:GntR family transcriptional regulator [Bacillus sp. EB106-08-02-XG196]NWQ44025.1 GntR family transcriptional regulator [Bacillus sp. EB106-08-02-XG196]